MTDTRKKSNENLYRGFAIATIGLLMGFAGMGLAFLDPSTGDGGNGGWMFKLGYAGAAVGFLTAAFGAVVHFAAMADREKNEDKGHGNSGK